MKLYDVLYYEININISAYRRVPNKFHTNLQFKYYNLFIKSIRVDRMFYAMLCYGMLSRLIILGLAMRLLAIV